MKTTTATTEISLDDIYTLAHKCLRQYGADDTNAAILANTVMCAERDGSLSHGLFRMPAYIASLKSGKINGCARPKLTTVTPSVLRVHGDNGFAQTAHSIAIPALVDAAKQTGIAVLAVNAVHHMAALWPEAEAIAEHDLMAMVCTSYTPAVAPAGGATALFGTNPIAIAWPRPNKSPVVIDMATAAMAKGEVQVAAREGQSVPFGTGLDKSGNPTTDPNAIIDGGVLLPFGGYKGSGLAMMVELLSGGLVGDYFSYEAAAADNKDGGPPRGGEFILAMSPTHIAGDNWVEHCEQFFAKLCAIEGVRLPGARRHQNRTQPPLRHINSELLEKVQALVDAK